MATFSIRYYVTDMIDSTKRLFYALALLVTVVSATACQRGYGCPNNFSVAVEQPSDAK